MSTSMRLTIGVIVGVALFAGLLTAHRRQEQAELRARAEAVRNGAALPPAPAATSGGTLTFQERL